MDIYFIILLGIAAYLSLRNEKDKKQKKLLVVLFTALIVIAFSYHMGATIGEFVYYLTN